MPIRQQGDKDFSRLRLFVYAIPIVLLAVVVIYAIVASWIPGT
jgi:hypothetical protein